MPIQFPDFQRISFDEANPMLTGMGKGQKMAQSFLQFPQDLQGKILANEIAKVQAKYAEPNAQAALKTAQQHNQFDPSIWGSEIGLRGAQAGLAGAQTGLTKSQAGMANLKLEYFKRLLAGQGGGQGGQPQGGGQMPGGDQGMTGGGAVGGDEDVSNNSALGIPVSNSSQQSQAGQQGGQNAPQGGGQQGGVAPANTMYGIEVPKPTGEDILNKNFLGIDTYGMRQENAKTQIQDQYKQFQDSVASSIQNANAAISMNQAMNKFNDAMDKSFYKGSRLGSTPSSGFGAAFVPGDMTPEQDADRAAMQMLPEAVSTLKDAMGQSRFSNLDMNMATKMKFDRTMNDDTRKNMTAWLSGVNNRMIEQSSFYSMLGNPRSGVTKPEADMLWSQYQNDFPLISKDGKTFQGENMGNWPLYTTPKAIASIKTSGTYSPTASERNTFMMKYPNGQILPVKRGKIESAFRKGARPL